jgi:TPR repeat protein
LLINPGIPAVFILLFWSGVSAYTDESISCYQAVATSSNKAAVSSCEEAAWNGDSESQFKLATLYAHGKGIKRNMRTSVNWLQAAADQGHPEAQYNLASAFQHGNGVKVDVEAALNWYLVSAKNGFAKSQRNLAHMYETGAGVDVDLDSAYLWFLKSADQGITGSQLKVGMMLLEGRGTNPDAEKAITWIRQSADSGNADAQFALGSITEEKDPGESVNLYEKAIDQDHTYAMYNLAVYLSKDGSALQEYQRASALADRAVKAGHEDSVVLKYAIDRALKAAMLQPATPHWLTRIPPDHYTIQLVLSSSIDRIRQFVEKNTLQGSARYYATLREGELVHILILGDYADHDEASSARDALPEGLINMNPFIQKIENLQDSYESPEMTR